MSQGWNLRYAPHLGYLPPNGPPLFAETVASADPWDHVAFAAKEGFAGVLYPWAISRPAEEVSRLASALAHFGLEMGSTVFAPVEALFSPLWIQTGRGAWETIKGHFDRSIPLARELGSRVMGVVIKGDEETNLLSQEEAVIEQLRRAGDLAASDGLVIGIEALISVPGMLLTTTRQTVALLERVDHPAVRMIFDTGHVQLMDGDVLGAYAEARDHICTLQLSDMPGRVEPGAGTIDFSVLLSEAKRDGNADGLIDLEHSWAEPSVAAERAGIEELRRIDATFQEG